MNIGFTSPVTQKKNGVMEQGFTTLYYKTIKMMAHTGLHDKTKTGLCSVCLYITKGMVEVHEENLIHNDILTLIKYIYAFVKELFCLFK